MDRNVLKFACVTCCLTISSIAYAAEKTVQGKVKAVDATKNSITLDDLELNVTRKTKITVEGKKGTLADIKSSQQAKVTYDDKLDVAVSIVIGEDESPSKSESIKYKKSGCRVVWHISDSGDSTLLISRPIEGRAKATDSMIRHDDGTVEFQHDLNTQKSVEYAMTIGVENVEFDKNRKTVVLTPRPIKGYEYKTSHFSYSKMAHLPLTIEYEFEFIGPSHDMPFGLNVRNRRNNTEFPFLNIRSKDDLKTTARLQTVWHAGREADGKGKFENLMEEQSVQLRDPNEFNFKIPLNVDDTFLPEIGRIGPTPAMLRYLSIRGRLSPLMGVALAEKIGGVRAENVIPNGLGEKVGMKSGDIILNINGEIPTSLQHAMSLLSKVRFGEKSEIVLKRNDETVKIEFTPE